jgi:hypothetical protein
VEPIVARKTWRTLEPYHGFVYFAREARERYSQFGLEGHDGYFAARAAPMGAVPAEVVIATFFNFRPSLVRAAIPAAWSKATPAQLIDARTETAGKVLTRILGEEVVRSSEVATAAGLARRAAEACGSAPGRPLYAGNASLAWPDETHVALWHAITLLREYRGDGHIACLVEAGLDAVEVLVIHAATGDVSRAALQGLRGWTDEEWQAAVERLAGRGIVDSTGAFTEKGRAARERLEARTDELALAPWRALGEDGCDRLRAAVRPMSRAIVDAGLR